MARASHAGRARRSNCAKSFTSPQWATAATNVEVITTPRNQLRHPPNLAGGGTGERMSFDRVALASGFSGKQSIPVSTAVRQQRSPSNQRANSG
jgi:hypothetical protein